MFLKQRYYEGGSKSMKILAWKLKKKTVQNTIHKIKDPMKSLEPLKHFIRLFTLKRQEAAQLR